MALFSERYGYSVPPEFLIKGSMPEDVAIAICNVFHDIRNSMDSRVYKEIEKQIWTDCLNQDVRSFYSGHNHTIDVIYTSFTDYSLEWYKKMDIIETFFNLYRYVASNSSNRLDPRMLDLWAYNLNVTFSRLHYAYRVVDYKIVEISSEEEVKAIEDAINSSRDNIKQHLKDALALYSKRPLPDYRNSIKESITAVEAYCREKTGEDSLGRSLQVLEKKGLRIHPKLKSSMKLLYDYTNQSDTGVRHALMETDREYVPTQAEALYMLITTSAFLNYMRNKESQSINK